MNTLCEVSLFYTGEGSDKFYHVSLVDEGGSFSVPFDYGRRGQAGQFGKKVDGVPYEKALKAFQSVIKEKVGKGYTTHEDGTPFAGADIPEIGGAGSDNPGANSTTKKASAVTVKVAPVAPANDGYGPQLLNPITEEEAEAYLADDKYGAQEKFDGKRLTLRYKDGVLQAFNKKDQPVGCDPAYKKAMGLLGESELIVSGEAIGKGFVIYDILSRDGMDLRALYYEDRHQIMSKLQLSGNPVFKVSPLAKTTAEKRALFYDLKASKKEGIVLKLLKGVHKPGRPNKLGDQLKVKFWASATPARCCG